MRIRSCRWATQSAVWLALALPGGAYSLPTHTVTVSAADRSYSQVPVTVTIPTPQAAAGVVAVTDLAANAPVPSTTCPAGVDRTNVIWIVRDLKQGETRRYRLASTSENPAPGDGWVTVAETEPPPEGEGRCVTIDVGGQLFTRYWFEGAPKPYCYPVIGPTGAPVTRGYPMAEIPGESHDHHHHRSLWFTFGEVNGHDFWAESDTTGREVHRAFEALVSGPACGVLGAVNDWIASDGTKVCEDERQLTVYNMPDVRLLDFAVTIRATDGPVEFGDTKEGMFGIRVASTMRVNGGQGTITNAAGQRDGDTWGQRAAWCDYSGPVAGETVGIAILDHPDNFRYPTYWHVRDYGLFAANPFGLRYFIGDKTGAGRHTVPAGEELTFRYRVLIHRGTCEEAHVADWHAEFAQPPAVELQADG
jgi:hypothetical protein